MITRRKFLASSSLCMFPAIVGNAEQCYLDGVVAKLKLIERLTEDALGEKFEKSVELGVNMACLPDSMPRTKLMLFHLIPLLDDSDALVQFCAAYEIANTTCANIKTCNQILLKHVENDYHEIRDTASRVLSLSDSKLPLIIRDLAEDIEWANYWVVSAIERHEQDLSSTS